MRDIKVTVSGLVGSGKTTVIAAIESALKDHGAQVLVVDNETPAQQRFERVGENLSEYCVTIAEQQLRRPRNE